MYRFVCRFLSAALLFNLLLPSLAQAQISSSDPVPPVPSSLAGPVPAAIAQARTVFLSSFGADPNFPIDSARVYNDVFRYLQQWGYYQLVDSPQQADLVFQLRGIAAIADVRDYHGRIISSTTPAFELTIIDPPTGQALWTISSPVVLTGTKKTYDHWVAIAENNLISRIQVLSGQPLSAIQSADLTSVPKSHGVRTAVILTSAIVGAGVAGGLILHHEFDNSLATQKASQDAFCTANHIPLNMCAGG
jgi:hypothetical protein